MIPTRPAFSSHDKHRGSLVLVVRPKMDDVSATEIMAREAEQVEQNSVSASAAFGPYVTFVGCSSKKGTGSVRNSVLSVAEYTRLVGCRSHRLLQVHRSYGKKTASLQFEHVNRCLLRVEHEDQLACGQTAEMHTVPKLISANRRSPCAKTRTIVTKSLNPSEIRHQYGIMILHTHNQIDTHETTRFDAP